MQSRIRCRLYIGTSMYDVTNDLINWDDIYSKLKRVNYGGVMRSFAGKFEFTRKARELIRADLMDKMVCSVSRLVWYERGDDWSWKEVFGYDLDVSSYDDDGSIVSISAVDNSLESIIKAKKGTQYEYSVDVIKEEKQLLYDRLEACNTIEYIIGNERNENDRPIIGITTPASKYSGINLEYSIDETSIGGFIEYGYDDNFAGKRYKTFARALKDVKIHFSVRLKTVLDMVDSTNFNGANVCLYKVLSSDGSFIGGPLFKGGYLYGKLTTPADDNIDMDIQMKPGEALTLLIESKYSKPYAYGKAVILENSNANISFTNKGDSILINIVSPEKLLNRLLKSMNGGKEGIVGEIASGVDDRIDNCLIVAAESVRGLHKAKLYTSFTKFCDWMSAVFGFVYEIDGQVVRFAHRDSMYSRVVVGNIGSDVSEFSCRVESSLIYSQVNVGYDKQDYDSINGRDEFRFTTEYSTGITLTNNMFALISPYRADAYGIEFLAQKRGADTTDKDSDNDVFFVGAKMNANGARWELVRGGKYQLTGVISPDTMFNAMFSPRQMLLANKAFIGISVDKLEYVSSNGNSDVVVGGIGEKESITIGRNEALFMPMSVTVKTSRQELPDSKKGLIMVEYDGDVYRGFIDDIERFHGRSKCNSYGLLLFDVTNET